MLLITLAAATALSLLFPVFGIVACLIAVHGVALVVGWASAPRVELTGHWVRRAVVGREVVLHYRVRNVGRLPVYDADLAFEACPDAVGPVVSSGPVRRIAPGQTAEFTLTFTPQRRGSYTLSGPVCASTFPFNLYRQHRGDGERHSLLVVPDLVDLGRPAIPIRRRYHRGGQLLAGRIGESPEYVGNRPFRPGDPPRRIDSRAWARLSAPVVKEYQEEYFGHAALVLDTFASTRTPAQTAAWETAVSVTASIAYELDRGDMLINVLAAGNDLYDLLLGRHITQFDKILEVLACVEPCRDAPFEGLLPRLADQLPSTSTVFLVLLAWDEPRRALARRIAEAGCRCAVFLVGGPWSDEPGRASGVDAFRQVHPRPTPARGGAA